MLPQMFFSFVIRINLEPREIVGAPGLLRGTIEDVVSGERRYFINFEQMNDFIMQIMRSRQPTLESKGERNG